MRVSNDRFERDMRRFNLAIRMLGQEARLRTVCLWTGLSSDRVSNLSQMRELKEVQHGQRRRGPSPSEVARFLTNASFRSEVDAVAGILWLEGLIPSEPIVSARRTFPNVPRGERLCASLEFFRGIVPNARLSLEQVALLLIALVEGQQWSIDCCRRCTAIVVVDRLALARRRACEDCQRDLRKHAAKGLIATTTDSTSNLDECEEQMVGEQLGLFDDLKKDPTR
jgi:hypothetical protein